MIASRFLVVKKQSNTGSLFYSYIDQGYGLASIDTPKPVTPSTLFYTGSTTKSFTAAAMSLLVDDTTNYSNIEWSTPISKLIRDDFVMEEEYATGHITIEDALSHRTGMPRHDASCKSHFVLLSKFFHADDTTLLKGLASL